MEGADAAIEGGGGMRTCRTAEGKRMESGDPTGEGKRMESEDRTGECKGMELQTGLRIGGGAGMEATIWEDRPGSSRYP